MPTTVFQLCADDKFLRELAGRRQISANRFLVEVIQSSLNRDCELEKEREWREGFKAMGRDPDVSDVEYALAAQRKVLFGE